MKQFNQGIRYKIFSVIQALIQTNIAYLKENGVSIWDEWADENGNLGPVYGYQWRSWPTPSGEHIDQIKIVLDQIRNTPDSRRLIVSAWNVADIPQMKLPPCHALFQFYVADNKLSCQLYQRSADMFLGVPFNIASYALLTHMMAYACGLCVGDFIWTGGDCHIYSNHFEQMELQTSRKARALPRLQVYEDEGSALPGDGMKTLEAFKGHCFYLTGYDPHPAIKGDVAV